jgi:hypothetical protein
MTLTRLRSWQEPGTTFWLRGYAGKCLGGLTVLQKVRLPRQSALGYGAIRQSLTTKVNIHHILLLNTVSIVLDLASLWSTGVSAYFLTPLHSLTAPTGWSDSTMLRTSVLRVGGSTSSKLQLLNAAPKRSMTLARPLTVQQQTRANSQAISNPTLANIEHRWEGMPPQEQADLWMALRDRMKVDWHDLTTQEKKAGLFVQNAM